MSLDISILQVPITIIKVINISHHLPKSPCVHSLFFEVDTIIIRILKIKKLSQKKNNVHYLA